MRYATLLTLGLACCQYAFGQLDLPVHLELSGTAPVDRQVMGLADPVSTDAAMSVDAARAGVVSSTTTTGTSTLIGTLSPDPVSLTPGMLVTIVPQEPNAAGALFDLNGTGGRVLLKWGGLPLDSADLPIGAPSRLVFDGTNWQVLNWNARPCPTGSSVANARFCVDDTVRGTGSYYEGVAVCAARGGRLCSFGEWSTACRRDPTFLPTVSGYEWIEDAANNPNDGKVMGQGYNGPDVMEGITCEYGNTHPPTTVNMFRCCYDR